MQRKPVSNLNRRSALKWLHWVSFFLILYFFLVEPDESKTDPGGALSTHAGVGFLLAITTATWLAMSLSKGLVGRAGPKLPAWAKKMHPLSHKVLQIGVPVMVCTGALAGLLAPFAINAFGAIPINFAGGSKTLHGLAEEIHEITFDALIIVIVGHAIFHLWRHFLLKDNALRLITPKQLHRFL